MVTQNGDVATLSKTKLNTFKIDGLWQVNNILNIKILTKSGSNHGIVLRYGFCEILAKKQKCRNEVK